MKTEELLTLVKELAELEDLSSRRRDVAIIKKEARSFMNRDFDTLAEQLDADEFVKYYKIIESRESSLSQSALDEKKALIEKAKALIDAKNYKKATEEMNDIFNAFKEAGRLTKEQDDALWTELKATKDEFNEKKAAYFASVKEANAEKKASKEEIIAKAKVAAEDENIKNASKALDELMEEWKKVGYCGKDDDSLWNEFNEVRKAFSIKRKAHYEAMQNVYEERVAKKEELIKKARIVLANSNYTKEEVNELKALRQAWKEVGFAGKEEDNALWEEFNGVVNKYFDSMHANNN